MINKKIFIKNVLYIVILIYLFTSDISNIFASEITTTKIYDSISKREQILTSGVPFSATFNKLYPAFFFDPNGGLLLGKCSSTWEKNDVYMKIDFEYLKEPVYVPPNSKIYQPVDYDSNKRLIVWRHQKAYIMLTAEKTERLYESQLSFVSPDGTIEKNGTHTSKQIFYIDGQVGGELDFRGFLLAAGLGFSDSITKENITIEKTINKENIVANCRGKFGKNLKGIWKLTLDPNEDFFVKEASYTATFDDFNNLAVKPSLQISTSDVVKKDGLQYARQGRLTTSDTVDFAEINISKKDNPELREEVKKRMSNLTPGSRIIDYNDVKPKITTVK